MKNILQTIKIIGLALVLILGVNVVSAAFPAPANPPANNVGPFLTIGAALQSRTGNLAISTTALPTVGTVLDIIGSLYTKGLMATNMTVVGNLTVTGVYFVGNFDAVTNIAQPLCAFPLYGHIYVQICPQ